MGYPQGFMTGALQSHARRYQLAIDTLSFGYGIKSMEVGADVSDPPEDGIYIDGLYLEAARWDRRAKKLRPSNFGEMMSLMPVIHFQPIQDYQEPKEDYQCPLYKTNVRAGILNTTGQSTNYVLHVSVVLPPYPIDALTHTMSRRPLTPLLSLSSCATSAGLSWFCGLFLFLQLPTDEDPDLWVLMGTAMVTMTND